MRKVDHHFTVNGNMVPTVIFKIGIAYLSPRN